MHCGSTNSANVMAFANYEKSQEIHDDFLFCQHLLHHKQTKLIEIAQMEQKIWSKLIKGPLQEFKCFHIHTLMKA